MQTKQRIKEHMLKGGIYHTWYRFSAESNYVTFNSWVDSFVEAMTKKQVSKFLMDNKLKG